METPTLAEWTEPEDADTAYELQKQLEQRRREAAADPDHRALMECPKSAPPFEQVAATVLSPEAIAASDRRRALSEQAERDQEESRREAAWQAFVERRGSRYAGCTLDNFHVSDPAQRNVVTKLKAYRDNLIDNFTLGMGVLLYGPVGTGKDHLLIELVRLAIAVGKSVAWMNGGDMFGMFRDNMDADEKERVLVERLVRPDVLYVSDPLPPLDDLPWFRRELLYRIIDARYSRCKPLWITTNVASSADLDKRMGPECGTRVRDGALCLFCNWPSHRKPAREVS